ARTRSGGRGGSRPGGRGGRPRGVPELTVLPWHGGPAPEPGSTSTGILGAGAQHFVSTACRPPVGHVSCSTDSISPSHRATGSAGGVGETGGERRPAR